ncbi:hypothetical protein PFISCL1PPCAC_11365 [Pristionchus fissidentatus]|uniref:Uncharacterized protein n=1 Tax=Pristionchus fissidentatus TaxID=1538716 RepID=A0AAV5VP01_9BILA|nr:hypothetical protein PFISCL1PPCAC_11365 [Pristionchus fissidentatus]
MILASTANYRLIEQEQISPLSSQQRLLLLVHRVHLHEHLIIDYGRPRPFRAASRACRGVGGRRA